MILTGGGGGMFTASRNQFKISDINYSVSQRRLGFLSFVYSFSPTDQIAPVKCLCCSGQGCLRESESTAKAAGGGQIQPCHAGLHHERRF